MTDKEALEKARKKWKRLAKNLGLGPTYAYYVQDLVRKGVDLSTLGSTNPAEFLRLCRKAAGEEHRVEGTSTSPWLKMEYVSSNDVGSTDPVSNGWKTYTVVNLEKDTTKEYKVKTVGDVMLVRPI